VNIDFGIKNERQDCKMGTVCVCRDTGGRGRGMKKIKVREYG
jgi:hypothetical protein